MQLSTDKSVLVIASSNLIQRSSQVITIKTGEKIAQNKEARISLSYGRFLRDYLIPKMLL